ncbi:DUF58 domain-containing protein [Clostridium sp. 19966]|uniref:DUF58 domain-containing protein n=1 Tax=Clostridium sp. 19966 TaxID=2768166 RepID=UPI0028DD85A0|nr:DUF58 domain-containing protein [Clostridium sp. 19966]MDT8718476.1 DUF58 domain-containing protein [Clostridium sp. 19966]
MLKINIWYVTAFIVSLIMVIVNGGNLYITIFYAILIFSLLEMVTIFLNSCFLKAEVKDVKEKFVVREVIAMPISFTNKSILPIFFVKLNNGFVKGANVKDENMIISMNPYETKKLECTMSFNTRGVYSTTNFDLEFTDVSGMIRIIKRCPYKNKIYIYPKIYEINVSKIKGLNIINSPIIISGRKIEDSYSLRDNRKYVYGDNIKRINWKVSAKHGELYVKNKDIIWRQEFNLMINMNKENYLRDSSGELEEKLIDTCASIIYAFLKKKVVSNIFINGKESVSMQIKDEKSFEKLMGFFLSNKSLGEASFSEFINKKTAENPLMKNMTIITAHLNQEITSYIITLMEKKRDMTIIYTDSENQEIINKLRRLKINISSIHDSITKKEV